VKYNELSTAIKSPVFSRNDLALAGHKVLDYQLSLWVKKRDIYDVSFLMDFTISDFVYIEKMLGMDQAEFLRRFDERLGELDLNFLARDVEPFLFASEQQERVTTFRDYWLNRNRREGV
jgi:hypothetical protein